MFRTHAVRNGHKVVPLRDKFPESIEDTDWMPALGREGGWAMLTKNPRICTIAHEREAWLQSKVTAFFLDGPWGNLHLWDLSWRLIRWWPVIVRVAEKAKPGSGYIVPASYTGRLRRVAVRRKEMIWQSVAAKP